jgi:hypothetical protein
MGLQVIGAGFGRTGTLSLKLALEQLGYVKCHHMMEVFSSGAQADYWAAIGRGEAPDWDKVFDGFQASVDFPSSIFYKELAAKYPDAKVILTVRSADSWWKSASQTIFAIGKVAPPWLKLLVPRLRKVTGMHDALIWDRVFGGDLETSRHCKQVFERHNAEVKKTIPASRLLVFEVKEGWGPLCAFLGKPVPATPFPNVNDTAEFRRRVRIMEILYWAPWVVLALIGCGLVLNAALTSAPLGT